MRMGDYHKSRRRGDEEALYGLGKKEKDPAEKVKDLPLDEIFFVLTRAGAGTFTKMLENSIERVVQDSVERVLNGGAMETMIDKIITEKFKEVASGIDRGLRAGIESQVEQVLQPLVNLSEVPKETPTEPKGSSYKAEKDISIGGNLHSRWSPQDLEYMSTTLMSQIAQGKTMGQAQEYVAEKLGRTKQAVGYQFSRVRDDLQEEYRQARIEGQKARKRG